MAPTRLNHELKLAFAAALVRAQQRRSAGIESVGETRMRVNRLLLALTDTNDWTPNGRARATSLFL